MKIRNLWNQGLNKTQIAKYLNINRKTVLKYLKKDKIPKYVRKNKVKSILEKYEEYIIERLDKYDLTAQKLYEEIKKQGYTGKYGIVAKYIRETKNILKNKAVLRFETIPGLQSQVDWGHFGTIYDKEKKRIISIYCFLIILGYSRTLYIEFFEKQDTISFLKGHNNSFKYFGGYTKEILYDNLKSVVIKRALKAEDSEFNKKFIDYSGYYGIKPILCRAYKPNTKGKVENSVNFVRTNFFAGEKFSSLRELNQSSQKWLEKTNNRIHSTTKQKPFDRLRNENLISIENKKLYDLKETCFRKVYKDCKFSYKGNMYSVPFKYAEQEVFIKQINKDTISISHRNIKIAEHKLNLKEKGILIINNDHYEGLKELRCSHEIKKPKKMKKKKEPKKETNNIILLNDENLDAFVEKRDLSQYEEVLSC